jgi:hypothetical protein
MSLNPLLRSVAAACCVVTSLGGPGPRGDVTPSRAEIDSETWVAVNYPALLDRVLGLEPPEGRVLPRDTRWIVSLRIVPSRRSEEAFTLAALEDGHVRLSVRRPSGDTLTQLVKRLHDEHPTAGVEEIADLVPLERVMITSDACPALKAESSRFLKLRLSTVPQSGLVLHGAGYEFLIAHWTGFRIEGHVNGSDALGADQSEPIASWAEHLHGVVEKCGAPPKP